MNLGLSSIRARRRGSGRRRWEEGGFWWPEERVEAAWQGRRLQWEEEDRALRSRVG